MKYIYGEFTEEQIKDAAKQMHNDVHKLLLYKDNKLEERIFTDEESFLIFFENVMYKFGGTKTLFNNNGNMVALMSILQAAYDNVINEHFNYKKFRKAILDCHGYIKLMFETDESGVFKDAEL